VLRSSLVENMAYDARGIANLILQEAQKKSFPVSNLVMQKLLFLAHAFFVVQKRRPLISAPIEAWQHGPVIREVYESFKEWKADAIGAPSVSVSPVTGQKSVVTIPNDPEVVDLIFRIVDHYGRWEPWRLVDLTHVKDGPWDYVVKQASNRANVGLRISDAVIRERFRYLWRPIQEKIIDDQPKENYPFE
jgi:uncharacterized phage-associated protein